MHSSIYSRFSFSLFANLSKAVITFSTSIVLARGLGPEQYGKMMFLIGTFIAIRQLLDMGSSAALFTFLSQKERSKHFVIYYFIWLGLQFFISLIIIGFCFPIEWIELIWKEESRYLVILTFSAVYIQSFLWSIIVQIGESQRLTRLVQGVAVSVAAVHLLFITFLWLCNILNIYLIFLLIIIEWFSGCLIIFKKITFKNIKEKNDRPNVVFLKFWHYCYPLIPYMWLGFAYEFIDRWLLQSYGGTIQQAYYSIAYQFGAVASIATLSIMNIFWKEISEAYHRGDQQRVSSLYTQVSRGLFFVSSAFSGLLIPWSEEILSLTLGSNYIHGSFVLAIMFLYPMHQSMGQICSTMLFATGKIYTQVIFGMILMALSIIVSYFLLAPKTSFIPGFGLEAIGLALKMVVMQFFGVNAMAIYLARSMKIRFDWFYQFSVGSICIGLGWFIHVIVVQKILNIFYANLFIKMFIFIIIYFILLSILIYFAKPIGSIKIKDFLKF